MMRIVAILLLGVALFSARSVAQDDGMGRFGAQLTDLTKEEADALGWEAPRGVKVVKPVAGGVAEAAGLKPDDILVSLDGMEIENVKAFDEAIGKKFDAAEVKLGILRDKREKRLAVKLAATKPTEGHPLVQPDTRGHMGLIQSLTFTPDGNFIVSAGDDKVIRIWDWRARKTVRTIRGQSGPGREGKIYSIALSPDGRWLAVGGRMAPDSDAHSDEVGIIRVFDFGSGELVALMKGHRGQVSDLVFSPNGGMLLSGSDDHDAIVWDMGPVAGQSRATTLTLTPLRILKGHTNGVRAVGFTRDGAQAVTGSIDKTLRVWRVSDGAPLQVMPGHSVEIIALAVSKDDLIVSGDTWGVIRLWDSKTGAFVAEAPNYSSGAAGKLTFSVDGRLLVARNDSLNDSVDIYANISDVLSDRKLSSYQKYDEGVTAAAFSPDGRFVASAGGSRYEIHVWDPVTSNTVAEMRGVGRICWAVGFSANESRLAWGNTQSWRGDHDRGPLEWTLSVGAGQRGLHPEPLANSAPYVRAMPKHGDYSLIKRVNPMPVEVLMHSMATGAKISPPGSLAYTFTPEGETIIAGGRGGFLAAYDLAGNRLGEYVGHESDVWAIASSPDGRYLVSGAGDQTVRLWNLKTRELLVTIFRGEDGEWVMWTPQGFYAASGPGAELVGWQINHGPAHEAEYVTAAQLRQHLNRPDIVVRAIQLASADAAVKEAHGSDFTVADLLTRPVPKLRILSPEAEAPIGGGYTELKVELQPVPDPVKLIRIYVNGLKIMEKQPDEGEAGFAGEQVFKVPLTKGMNRIVIVATNDTGETFASAKLIHEGEGALDKRGTLYILSIGVDQYKGLGFTCGDDGSQSCDLRFAGADAKAFAAAMEKDARPLHDRVVKRVLVNGGSEADAPTTANILDALGLLRDAKENDTVMVFVSGHGVNEGPNYRFVPTDAAWNDRALRPATVVPWYAFQEALTSAQGRRILFLDTCHSGNAFNQKLIVHETGGTSVMGILQSGGALEQYTALREELGRAQAEVVGLRQRLETAEKIESTKADLDIRRAQLAKAVRDDIHERSDIIREAIVTFEELSASRMSRPEA